MPRLFAALIVATFAGCGTSTPAIGLKAPHGGTMAVLPDGLGHLEIVRQEMPGASGQVKLTLYFFDPEVRPMSPGPAAASLRPKQRNAKVIAFKADPSNGGALESEPFASTDDIAGELTTTVGGRSINLSIVVR